MRKEQFKTFVAKYYIPIRDELDHIWDDSLEYFDDIFLSSYKDEFEYNYPYTLDSGLIEFYSIIESWKTKWKTKEEDGLEGSFNILSLEKVMIGDVDFYPDDFPRMKNFTLLDYFFDESAVGFYLDKPELGLFYFEFDSNPRPLNLDFNGYLEMLKYTKGYAYWQLSVLTLAAGHQLARTDIYDKVTALFPDFSAKGFEDLYNSVKLK